MFGLFDPVLHNAAGVTSQAQSDVGCSMTGMHGALTQDVELRNKLHSSIKAGRFV